MMRKSLDPLSYRLLVRPRELHLNWIYVLILIPPFDQIDKNGLDVNIVGWANSEMLPKEPAISGVFAGAHVLNAFNLNAMPVKQEIILKVN